MTRFSFIYIFTALFASIALMLFVVNAADAQDEKIFPKNTKVEEITTEGKEFYLCFQRNYKDSRQSRDSKNDLTLELFLTAGEDANAEITIEGLGYKRLVKVPGGTVVQVKIDPSAQVTGEEIIQKLAVHIVADVPISVYGLNHRFQTTDTYLGLPVSALGTEYRVMGYRYSQGLMSQFAVIGTEDGTEVTITPTTLTSKFHQPGTPYKVRLNAGEVYQVAAHVDAPKLGDLTGTLIQSDKKVAVFSGHQCAYVPDMVIGCNFLVEQLPPISAWGKHYYVGLLQGRTRHTIRVLASEPKTKVFENSTLVAVLNAGEFYENSAVRQNIQVTADKPILVAQYSQGFGNGDSLGDPMMLLISPTQQFMNEYRFATPISGEWNHYINVVIPTKSISTLRLDGRRVDSAIFQTLGLSRYSIAQIQIKYGTHIIKAKDPFGLYSYGFGYKSQAYDAYGTMGGQTFFKIEDIPDTIAPSGDSRTMSDRISIVLRDDRTNDRGLKSVNIVYAQGLQAALPKLEEGVPQISFFAKPTQPNIAGRMVIQAVDVAGNTSLFTVCYTLDAQTERYGYSFADGESPLCLDQSSWSAGAFVRYATNYHSASFSRTGGVQAKGEFGVATEDGGYFGAVLTKRILGGLGISARLTLENCPGTLLAYDSVISNARDASGNLLQLQEGRTLRYTGLALGLSAAAEWYVDKNVYLLGGAEVIAPLTKSIEYKRTISSPGNFVYIKNEERNLIQSPSSLETINSVNFAVFGGLGFSYPINIKTSIFLETLYTRNLSSFISDGDWMIEKISFNAGARFRL